MTLRGVLLLAQLLQVASLPQPPLQNLYWEWQGDGEAGALVKKEYNFETSQWLSVPEDADVRHHYARAGQDQTVMRILKMSTDGAVPSEKKIRFFVDLAANHYAQYSNSFHLEKKHGWNGICVEPNVKYTAGLLANRNCSVVRNVVTAKNGETVEFLMTDGQGGIVGTDFDNKNSDPQTVKIVGVTLNTILDTLNAPESIDYLSLDVEGAETIVMENFDFSKHKFLIMTVERPKKSFHDIVVSHGYWWVNRLEAAGEMLYIHETLNNFDVVMRKIRGSHPMHHWAPHAQPHKYLLTPPWPIVKTES